LSSWKDGRVLVTGAGGFIGSHLLEELVRRGACVRAFLHYNSRGERGLLDVVPAEIVDEVDTIFGDLRDADTVRYAVQGATSVFHLGALIAIPYSYASPRDVVETNVLGTLNVLMAAREAGVRRVVHTSTSEVYGTAQYVPIDESHPLQGQSPYAASKIGADQLAESFHRSYGLPVSIVRPFNTFGPRQSARAVIPTIMSQALTGSVVRLGSTMPTRDFNFVTDTVRGFLCVADSPQTVGEILNVGTGRETTVADLITVIGKLLDRELEVKVDDHRLRPADSEVYRLVADATKIRRLCNWEPTVSLEEGLSRTLHWMRANMSRYRPDIYGV
jgi:NAD dependent epimerase/dehydratase